MERFAIHALQAGGGTLAISPMPGRGGHYGADWLRLVAWRPDLVLTMTPRHELERKGAGSLGRDLAQAGIGWLPLPVADFGVPEAGVQARWPEAEARALEALAGGGRVLVHCHGGCGRSGMAMLRLMRACGEDGAEALARLRALRPCAIETKAQLRWALSDL